MATATADKKRNDDLIEHLPEFYEQAVEAATRHFHELWECIAKELPECVRKNFNKQRPKGFTDSTTRVGYVISSANHVPIRVQFEYNDESQSWELESFIIPLQMGFIFQDHVACGTLADALLAAREIYEVTHVDQKPELDNANTEGLRVM